jgi:hypothetical protein
MEATIVLIMAAGTIGFLLGYGVREAISHRHRAIARRRRDLPS